MAAKPRLRSAAPDFCFGLKLQRGSAERPGLFGSRGGADKKSLGSHEDTKAQRCLECGYAAHSRSLRVSRKFGIKSHSVRLAPHLRAFV
jgi:hypothetical protein